MFRSGSLSNMNAAGMNMGHVGGMWMIPSVLWWKHSCTVDALLSLEMRLLV